MGKKERAVFGLLCRSVMYFVVSYHLGYFLNLPVVVLSSRTFSW